MMDPLDSDGSIGLEILKADVFTAFGPKVSPDPLETVSSYWPTTLQKR